MEPGAKVAWQVIGIGGNTVRGPVVTANGSARVGPLPQGSFLFQVRQTDAAGNSSEWRSEPFAVAPGATVAGGPRLPSHNAKALTPRLGARLSTPRPLLGWKASPKARLYNLQIFRVAAKGRLAKIRSVFPRGNRFRLSKRRQLAEGRLLRLAGVALPGPVLHEEAPRGQQFLREESDQALKFPARCGFLAIRRRKD